jgi:hypothetical protein
VVVVAVQVNLAVAAVLEGSEPEPDLALLPELHTP